MLFSYLGYLWTLYFRMMFEAFGFSKVSLRCRNLSQLPSGGLLWQICPLYLTLRSIVVYVLRRIADICSLVVLRSTYLGLALTGNKLTFGRACHVLLHDTVYGPCRICIARVLCAIVGRLYLVAVWISLLLQASQNVDSCLRTACNSSKF